MAEGQFLFNMDYRQFTEVLNQKNNLFKLREKFDTSNVPLSRSLLISQETEDHYWLLADFENQKTYDIKAENSTSKYRRESI